MVGRCVGYDYEPKYSEDELAFAGREKVTGGVATDTEAEPDRETERLTDLCWCLSSRCGLMSTVSESRCCQEFDPIKVKVKSDNGTACITEI